MIESNFIDHIHADSKTSSNIKYSVQIVERIIDDSNQENQDSNLLNKFLADDAVFMVLESKLMKKRILVSQKQGNVNANTSNTLKKKTF